jgi:7-keto-8-aminopelargonate synthetase-like enzyme
MSEFFQEQLQALRARSLHRKLREIGTAQGTEVQIVGAGASRLISGTQSPHVALEVALAKWKRAPAAISFSNGYAAAVGTLPALASKRDVIILDKLSHASLIDGARLSGATLRVFPHNHLGKLESHLEWARRPATDRTWRSCAGAAWARRPG